MLVILQYILIDCSPLQMAFALPIYTVKKIDKISKWILLGLLILLVTLYIILHFSPVQTWLVNKVAKDLSGKLHTRVTIQKVNFRFFNRMVLAGLMVEDRQKDTLLYAGTARLNITDWFFFKKKAVIKYVDLDNAIINMNRKDSLWNYQFLFDYFVTPKKSSSPKKGIEFSLDELQLNNVRINKKDQWIGQDMIASIKKLALHMDLVDFNRKQLVIKELYLEQPFFAQSDYTGNRPVEANLTNVLEKIPVVSAFKWNNSGWTISLKDLNIVDGGFRNDKKTERPVYADRFDGQHLFFSGITGSMKNILFINDTLTAEISLKAKERSGLLVKKLRSNMKFMPELMEFNNLDLETNRSRVGNYYSMRYKAFNRDMNSFINNVILEGNFKESTVSSDDLAIFAPAIKSWNRNFILEGNAKGTIDNFSVKNMKIRSGNTYVDGNISLRGLPDINTTFIDFRSKLLQTNHTELLTLVPSLKNVKVPAINKLGTINYKGNFTGFIEDFVAYGIVSTSLGNITADMNMKLPFNGRPAYSGTLFTSGFDIGQFLNITELGMIALNGNIKGSGFSINELNANFDGKVNKLDLGGYSYQNISINGKFEKKLFKGHLSVDDPNVKIRSLDGLLSLSEKEIAFNVDADVQIANLGNIGLSKDNLSLSGFFSLDFTGNNIDNFLGTARVYDARLQHDTTRLSFDSLTLRSMLVGDKKVLSLSSNEVKADIAGKFNIQELPDAFRVFFSRYYPSYIKAPGGMVSNQDFVFSIQTNQADQYVRLIDKNLSGFNNATITGSLKLDSYRLNVNALIPEFSYAGKTFTNTVFRANGNRDTLFTDIAVEDIRINDSLHLPDSRLKVSTNNDLSMISLKTSAGKTFSDAELNASIRTFNDGVRIHFFPSSFVINDKKWLLEKDGEITLRKNFIDANEVKFVHGNQQIVISSELDELTDNTHLIAKLKNVNIEDFLPFIVTRPSLQGLVTGTATVRDPFGRSVIEFEGVADSFVMDGKYIGKVNISGNANTNTGLVSFRSSSSDSDYVFNIDGSYNFKDSSSNQLDVTFLSDRFNINILEPYLGAIFSQMSGIAKSNLKITGVGGKQYITGEATITGGSLKVAYTQCRYLFDNETITFGKDFIDLGSMKLKDTLNNEGVVTGKMVHHFFKDFSFENMRFETGRMLLLNTTKKDNSQFYGHVTGRALMTMSGPVTNLRMNIDGEPSPIDTSHIYLPTGTPGKENTAIDYLEFIQFGSEMDEEFSSSQSANITVNMNLVANPACKIDVILDAETGDIIKGQGNGRLLIRVGTTEPLSIRGRYELTKGEYTFNFQTFLRKPFTLSSGSITWNGDPYLAVIDINAEYLAKNVDVSSLTTNSGFRQKEDITIVSHLSGNLFKPLISFEFQLPEKSDLSRDYFTIRKLADFKNDENEMNKQVASLLLFNSFIDPNQNFLSGGNTIALATNTIGGVISGWLTNVFNKELDRATKGVISTYIDINPTLNLQKNANELQANVRAGLRILLSSRINILIGGNLDYNNPYTALDRKGLLTPDITIEWLLNKDGSLRVVGFNRTSIDITSGQRNRSGVQLSYRKDFNKLSDIFKTRKRIRQEDSTNVKISSE